MAPISKSMFKRLFSCFIALFIITSMALAQGNGGNDPDFPNVPVDGGLSLLLAAGAAYGGKKIYNYRKSRQENK